MEPRSWLQLGSWGLFAVQEQVLVILSRWHIER